MIPISALMLCYIGSRPTVGYPYAEVRARPDEPRCQRKRKSYQQKIVVLFLWIAILSTILNFLKVSEIAGILLIPYILWVTFAAVLNASIFALNIT